MLARAKLVLVCLAISVVPAATAAGLADNVLDASPPVTVAFSSSSCNVSAGVLPSGPVRFRVVDRARRTATFSVGSHATRVRPKRVRVVIWTLDAGTVPYRCRLGSRFVRRGMFTVTAPVVTPPPAVNATIALTGPPQVMFDWTTQRCDEFDIPDAPTRVFRDSQGVLQLLASHRFTRRMVGPSLDAMTRDCRVVLNSQLDPRPEMFDESQWIIAPYTLDGETVYALLHHEYHGQEHGSTKCPSGSNDLCWYDAVTSAVSTDRGATYTHAVPPAHVVAAPPWRYVPDHAGLGYYGATNIVRNPADGYFYAMIGRALPGLRGTPCVMRTSTLERPNSWRFWDGKAFVGTFVNPYTTSVINPAARACPSIGLDVLAESLTWNTYLGRWLLIGSKAFTPTDGAFFFSTSTDLVHWTDPKAFHQVELTFTYSCGDDDPVAYASLVDPASPAPNFDVSGKTGWLYYTKLNYRDCRMNLDRDLVRVPIELTLEP